MDEKKRGPLTIEDIALAAGVSRATASRALMASDAVSTPARERVRAVAAELGYTPNPIARALAGGPGTRVVVAVSGPSPAVLDDPYLWHIVRATADVCDREGLGVSVSWLPLAAPTWLQKLAGDRSVRGVLLVNTTEAVLAAVPASLRGRVASIGIGSSLVPSFDVDNAAGAAAVVDHLYATGRRRIAMITGPEWLPCARRSVEAYVELMGSAGLQPRTLPGDFTAASGSSGAREALREWPDTDAIFAVCDATALGAMATLHELGVDVPADVAVAGFDDVPAAALSWPTLTTATHPAASIAAAAAAAVIGAVAVPSATVYPSELVVRKSA